MPTSRIVFKFGGTSVATPRALRASLAHAIAARQAGQEVMVVLSAQRGVTDLLLGWAERATRRRPASTAAPDPVPVALPLADDETVSIEALLGELRVRHADLWDAVSETNPGHQVWQQMLDEVRTTAQGLLYLGPAAPADALVLYGERLMLVVAQAFFDDLGLRTERVDGTDVIVVDESSPTGWVDLTATRQFATARLEPVLATHGLVLVTGYAGRTRAGAPVTLGRGGSDLTASILASAMDADSVWLGKDVPALLTADPRVVPSARPLSQVSPEEAQELAFWGSQVLHPRTLIPLAGRGIPMAIFASDQAPPAHAGTWIAPRSDPAQAPTVVGMSIIRHATLLTLQGKGLLGVPGTAARLCGAVASVGGQIQLLTQGASEGHLCLVIPKDETEAVLRAVEQVFAPEYANQLLDPVLVDRDISVMTLVGDRMRARPGAAAALCGALAQAGVNIRAIAQGSSERSISVVIARADMTRGAQALHRLIEEEASARDAAGAREGSAGTGASHPEPAEEPVRLGLLGRGQIATALLQRLAQLSVAPDAPDWVRRLRVAWIAGGTIRRVASAAGWSLQEAADALTQAGRHGSLRALDGRDEPQRAEPPAGSGRDLIVLDTAAGDTTDLLCAVLAAGGRVVTANKGPLADVASRAEALWAAHTDGRLRAEATVGAGVPVLRSLIALQRSGEQVRQIELHASGTLSFITERLSQGQRFDQVLAEAVALGLTEPDPRLDLSGQDVARKAVILARHAWGASSPIPDVTHVEVRPLWTDPEAAQDLDATGGVAGLLDRAAAAAPSVAAAWAAQGPQGRWGYAGRLTEAGARVGPLWCAPPHPYAAWTGSANLFRMETQYTYPAANPFLIGGPGAGAASTVSALVLDLADLVRRDTDTAGRA